ncbi:MAG: DUF4249 domain-containing protein [Saprospiraceae bacterium]
MKFSTIPFVALLVLFSACERDARLDLNSNGPEVVVLSNFSDLDPLEVVVSETRPVLGEEGVEYIPDARVVLYINGFLADTLRYVASPLLQTPGYYVSSVVAPKPGDRCSLVVEAPGFDPVTGESRIPLPVLIDTAFTTLVFEEEQIDETLSQATIEVKLKVLHEPGGENYFHLNFYQQGFDFQLDQEGDTIKFPFFSLPLPVTPGDDGTPLVPYIENRGVLFTEQALEGNQGILSFTMKFQYYPQSQLLEDFHIELRTTSREYFLYHRSLARQHQAGQHPFSEPVILYSNIENGHGIFAGFTPRFFRVETSQ